MGSFCKKSFFFLLLPPARFSQSVYSFPQRLCSPRGAPESSPRRQPWVAKAALHQPRKGRKKEPETSQTPSAPILPGANSGDNKILPRIPNLPKEPNIPREPRKPNLPRMPNLPREPREPKETDRLILPKEPNIPNLPNIPREPKKPNQPREPNLPTPRARACRVVPVVSKLKCPVYVASEMSAFMILPKVIWR